jgi:hypothetical protein
MNEFADEVPSEDFLDEYGLLCKVGQTFGVAVCSSSLSKHSSGIVSSEVGLNLGGCCLFAKKLLSPDVHLKL